MFHKIFKIKNRCFPVLHSLALGLLSLSMGGNWQLISWDKAAKA
jgi:hypothetical protein